MVSAKAYYNQIRGERDEWRYAMPQECMNCGSRDMLEIHEMERKSHASGRWGHTCNYLLLCQVCHADDFAAMPHERQLAVKLVRDAEHFDLESWLRIRDAELRAPERVTLADIARHLRIV